MKGNFFLNFLPITKCRKKPERCDCFSLVTSHLEPTLIQMAAYVEKRCISILGSDTDSTVISNSEGSQHVETDQWDFVGSIGDQISDGNTFGGIMENYRFEPCVSDSDEHGDNGGVGEDKNTGRMFTTDW